MLVAVVLAITAALSPLAVFAGEPTVTPEPSVTPAPTPVAAPRPPEGIQMQIRVTDSAIVWEPVAGAIRYHVQGTVTALRISAAGVCEAPLQQDRRELTFDESVDGGATTRPLGLPVVTPDKWFIVLAQLQINAINADDEDIGGGNVGHVAETCMRRADPTPSRQLPSTGSGGGPETNTATVLGAMIATAAATTLVLAGMYGIHRRIRVRDQ